MTSIDSLLLRVRVHLAGIVGLLVASFAGYQARYLLVKSGEELTRGGVLFDDAFFYTTLARNFVKLGFLTLDGETPTNGVQPLWQALLIALHWLFPSWELVKVSVVVSWALYVGFSGLLSAWLWRVCAPRPVLPVAFAASVGLVSSTFYGVVLRGLETPMFLFTFSLWLWAYEVVRTQRTSGAAREWHYALWGFVCALLFLSRTDWFLASIGSFLWLWIVCRPIVAGKVQPPAVKVLMAFVLPIIVLVMPYVVHNWVVHGHPMPISGRVKLHYMKTALPTLEEYIASEEWRGLFSLLQQVFRLSAKGKSIAVGTWVLWLTALGVGGFACRRVVWVRLILITVFGHWAFMQFVYRELRPYTNYYFAIEILAICVLLGALLGWAIERISALPKSTWLATAVALMFATVWISTNPPPSIRATARWDARLHLARDLKKLPASAKIGAFWPGVFAYYSKRSVFPLDGIIGSQDYFEKVVKQQTEVQYAQKHGIEYIVSHFPLKAIQGPHRPRSSNWAQSAKHRLWGACRNLRSTSYSRGRWTVLQLSKNTIAPASACPGRP